MVVDLGPIASLPGSEDRTPTRASAERAEEAWQALKWKRTSLGFHIPPLASSRLCNHRPLQHRCSHWLSQRRQEVASLRFHWRPTWILPNTIRMLNCSHSQGSRSSRSNASTAGIVGGYRYRRLLRTLSSLSTETRTRYRFLQAHRVTRLPTLPTSNGTEFLPTRCPTRIFFPSSKASIPPRYRHRRHRHTTFLADKHPLVSRLVQFY